VPVCRVLSRLQDRVFCTGQLPSCVTLVGCEHCSVILYAFWFASSQALKQDKCCSVAEVVTTCGKNCFCAAATHTSVTVDQVNGLRVHCKNVKLWHPCHSGKGPIRALLAASVMHSAMGHSAQK
jgi:hypothetical protein